MRIGSKKRPFYRVVVVDERAKRTGGYVEAVGTYNPLAEPKDIKLKQDRIDYWIKMGAQPSTGYLRIIGKAPQRPPRKPKKEKSTVLSQQTTDKPKETSTEVTSEEHKPEQVKEAKEEPKVVNPQSSEKKVEETQNTKEKYEGST